MGKTFLIVGGGKMGEAMVSGWLACDVAPAAQIHADHMVVVNPGAARREHLQRAYGVRCVPRLSDAPPCDVVVLAVKPQVMMDVLAECDVLRAPAGRPLFVSIAAGLSTERIAAALPDGAPVVRVMPNMPLMAGAGASAVCGGRGASAEQVDFVVGLFACLGRAVVVRESDMDAVCALSGSGPAYVAALIESLRDAAAAEGLDPALAEELALQTVLGTARLIDESGLAPRAVREAVCSPGGTTLAALDAMREAGFGDAISAGVAAASARSKELSQC